jgi:hypothetical protein
MLQSLNLSVRRGEHLPHGLCEVDIREARLRKKAAPQLGDSRRTKTSGLPVPTQVQPCRWKERAESERGAVDGHADVGRGRELLGIRRVGWFSFIFSVLLFLSRLRNSLWLSRIVDH